MLWEDVDAKKVSGFAQSEPMPKLKMLI